MGEAIEQCAGYARRAEDAGPLIERQIAGNDDRAALIVRFVQFVDQSDVAWSSAPIFRSSRAR